MSDLLILSKYAVEAAEKSVIVAKELKKVALQENLNMGLQNSAVDPVIFSLTVFLLSCFIGYYVVWRVTPALHTPLMSVTNAISGIIIIGSMVPLSSSGVSFAMVFGFIGTFIAAINIFGGFVITQRMLGMFRKK